MARSIRSNSLENRSNRLKLPVAKKPVFVKIGNGLSLGYRRNASAGTRVLRIADGKGGSSSSTVGHADDYDESNGQTFLTYFEAQDAARKLAVQANVVKPLTVQDATNNYLNILTAKNVHTAYDTKLRLQKHFLQQFGDKLVSSLTKTMLETWLSSLVSTSTDKEDIRRSKDSANRVLGMVRAILNHALKDQTYNLNDSAWRHVKIFKGVGQPRTIRYTHEQLLKIIDCAPDNATRNLIRGCALTGCRYGEATSAKVSSIDLNNGMWEVSGKMGKRTLVLQDSAVEFFKGLVNGRQADEFLFVHEDGRAWKADEQTRPFKIALARAGLPTDGSIYALRHTAISIMLEGGVPIKVIADQCGTSVRMVDATYSHILIEKQRAFVEAGALKL
jgi:integrase